MLKLLERTPPNLKPATWEQLEFVLRKLAGLLPNTATVYDYVTMLWGLRVCPRLTPQVIRAVQSGFARDWENDSALGHIWTTYTLSHLQHNMFDDFAAAADEQPDVNGPSSVYVMFQELVQSAVAVGDNINVVGYDFERG